MLRNGARSAAVGVQAKGPTAPVSAPPLRAAAAMVLAHHLALLNSKRVVRKHHGRRARLRTQAAPPSPLSRALAAAQVLASASPRRSELLQMLVRARLRAAPVPRLTPRSQGLRFEVHVSTFDETLDKSSFASAAGAPRLQCLVAAVAARACRLA